MTKPDLRDQVKFDRDALDNAIEEQAGLFLQAADSVAEAVSLRDEAKSEMDQEYAKACDRARKSGGDERRTESAVKEIAQLDKKYIASEAAWREAKLAADMASNLREAFDMRGKALAKMVDLYISGYYQKSTIEKGKRNIDYQEAAQGRRAMTSIRNRERKN